MFGTRSKINRQRNGLVRFRFSPYRGNEWRPYTPSVARSATRRNFFATVVYVYVSCTQAREEESPGSFTHPAKIWIKKKGMDILDFSPLLIIIEILVYTWSFRGGGEGKEEHYVCTILVSSLFLIYSKISSLLLYFLTFVIPLIFIAQLSHFLPFSKKITFLLSFFFFFFCLYIIWSIFVIILQEFSSIEEEN